MNVNGQHYRTIWLKEGDPNVVQIIDQRHLPHKFVIEDLATVTDVARAIKDMHVRGAGLIGATAGYGMYLAALQAPKDSFINSLAAAGEKLKATRPTAVNLAWAVERQLAAINAAPGSIEAKIMAAAAEAQAIADEDADYCRRIGEHGLTIIEEISHRKNGEVVNILTHCNAGWLAFVDYGSATAPMYAAHDKGINIHVWVDETRPRNQGARLTAWELGQHGVPHTVIADNVGGHLMQHGLVDLVLTGTDRTTYTGDVGNKIGTYLKALAAHDNNIPFYTALPSSTFDWEMRDGVKEVPIEQRDASEVRQIQGLHDGEIVQVLLTPENSPAANFAFDVTPARLVTGLITERGICPASEAGVLGLYPEKKQPLPNNQ
jgi:methylthioribose-1-phosphate isomerase